MDIDKSSEIPCPGRVFISGERICILGSQWPIYPGFWKMSKVSDPNDFTPEFDTSSFDFRDDESES